MTVIRMPTASRRVTRALSAAVLMCAVSGARAECPETLAAPEVPDALTRATIRLNLLERTAERAAFMAVSEAAARARPSARLLALYADHVSLLPRLRYVEGRADLARHVAAIGKLGRDDRCRMRALLEHDEAGVRVGALLAYRPKAIERLAGTDPQRVADLIEIFGALGGLYHRIGARRHFFDITYHFVDVFEPIRRRLAPSLAKRVGEVLDDFGQRRAELFADLPSGTRPGQD